MSQTAALTRRQLLKATGLAPLVALGGGAQFVRLGAQPGSPPFLRLFLGEVCQNKEDLEDLLQDSDLRFFLQNETRPLLIGLSEGLASTHIPAPAPVTLCPEINGDVNGDGSLDIGDPVYTLRYLFSGGPDTVPLCNPQLDFEVPTGTLTASDKAFLRNAVMEVLPGLMEYGPKDTPPPDSATLDMLVAEAIDSLHGILESPRVNISLSLANCASLFDAAIIDRVLFAADKVGGSVMIMAPTGKIGSQDDPQDDTTDYAQLLLFVDLIIELIGLVAGLFGLAIPKVNLSKVLKAVRPMLKSPSVRNAYAQLLRILRSTEHTLADKAQAIVDFLEILASIGLLGAIVAEIIDQLNWKDFLVLAIQLAVFVATFVSTAGALTAARLVIVLGASLINIIEKIDKLIESGF